MKTMKFLLFLALFAVVFRATYTQGTDLTLVPNASGPDVVRAVLSKLDASGAFGDSSIINVFMRRLAYVETQDGQTDEYPDGGIWNVSRITFTNTQNGMYSISESVYSAISTYFGINWRTGIQYTELRRPLYSGLAVRLYLMYLEDTLFLTFSRQFQDDIWIDRFEGLTTDRDTLSNRWNTAVQELENNEACRVEADVVFVLDASGSIGPTNFDRVRTFTYSFADELIRDIDNHENRIGVISYSNTATVEIRLNSALNKFDQKAQLLQAIRSLPYRGGGTNTPEGLCQMAAQPWRSGLILRLAVVLTDGMANRQSVQCGSLQQAAIQVKSQSPAILVYAIGVGDGVNTIELETIASGPHFIDHVDSFTDGLETAQDIRSYEICFTADQSVEVGDANSQTSGQGQMTRLSLRAPQEEGITIRICIRQGRLILYASTSVRNPSTALNDWSASVTATEQSVNCLTEFFSLSGSSRRRRATNVSEEVPFYLSIEGVEANNEFTLNSSAGDVTFDTNECEQGLSPCPEYASCHNTDGSYFCLCLSGFAENGTNCTDINECEEEPVPCADQASCHNTIGSFYCRCLSGYIGNGTECEDLNECDQDPYPCPRFESCVNTEGGHTCTVNRQLVIITTVCTAGPIMLLVIVCAMLLCICCKIQKRRKKPEQAQDYSNPMSTVVSTNSTGNKTKLKEPFQADIDENSFTEEVSDDDDSESGWNYTMTVTWQQDEDGKDNDELKTAYI